MDFIDLLQTLSANIAKQIDLIQTEEATKTAFIMPFINALGYNVFDPSEVVPEYIADVGTKKGEKVDYAIMKDGKPIMLFECKWSGFNLNNANVSQLYRYFSVCEARIAVLTNGLIYRFFTDLDEANKMDKKPFLEFNMKQIDLTLVKELKRISKPSFDIDKMLLSASDLKYTREIKHILEEQLSNPSEEIVKFFASSVYSGKVLTQKVKEQFIDITKRAFNQFVNDRINARLKSALSQESDPDVEVEEVEEPEDEVKDTGIQTTEQEIEAYHIIKSILRETIDPSRIYYRDTKSYFGILLDDSNRKTICRVRIGAKRKCLGFIIDRTEDKVYFEKLDDIYKSADKLKEAVLKFEKP